jgi:hypothetical protein
MIKEEVHQENVHRKVLGIDNLSQQIITTKKEPVVGRNNFQRA